MQRKVHILEIKIHKVTDTGLEVCAERVIADNADAAAKLILKKYGSGRVLIGETLREYDDLRRISDEDFLAHSISLKTYP